MCFKEEEDNARTQQIAVLYYSITGSLCLYEIKSLKGRGTEGGRRGGR